MSLNIRLAGKQGTSSRRTAPIPEHSLKNQLRWPIELPTRRQIYGPWLRCNFAGFTANFRPRPLAPDHPKGTKHYQLTLSLAAPRQWRPVDGPRAGNVLQRLVRSRFTRWFQSTSQLACELQRSPAPARDPAPIQTTKLPVPIKFCGEQPHNLGTLPITRKMPILASNLDDRVAGLDNDAKPEATTEFSAKAYAPNYYKNDRCLGL